MIDAQDLPSDIEELKAIILAQKADIIAKDEAIIAKDEAIIAKEADVNAKEDIIIRLEHLVKAFKQAIFGRKSEKIDPDQFELAFEDIETAVANLQADDDPDICDVKAHKKLPVRNRGALPKHLPRVEVTIEPEYKKCACGYDMHVIGEDCSERLDIIPAQFQVIITKRPKYACRSCEGGITQAPAPAHLVPSGLPTEALISHVLISKYADHLPLYRQAQIYSRQGIDLDRSTLAHWVGKAAFELKPIYDCLLADLKTSTKLFMDETKAPVLDPGRGKTKTGYFWALARNDTAWRDGAPKGGAPPGVVYSYAPGRSGHFAETILEGFSGILQVDGYAGYNRLQHEDREGAPLQLAYCWAHARRKLADLVKISSSPVTEAGLKQIAAFYKIEADIKGQTAETRLSARQTRTAPLMDGFKTWLDQQLLLVSRKSPLGEALRYIFKYWDGLNVFLQDGRVEMDNNAVERTIRPIALNRKNALFAGHDKGAENWGIIASLIETCKLNNTEPQAYLTDTLEAIVAGHKQSQIKQLLPWNYKSTNSTV